MNDNPTCLYPKEVILEVTNRCNLQCRHCHFHGPEAVKRRPLGAMARPVWKSVLQEIASWSQPVTLLCHGAGEPLLYPQLRELIAEAKQIPHVCAGFMTNGMLLDEGWARFLVEMQVDWIAFSVDGVVPETHDYFRNGASLRTIEANVFRLIEEKERRGSVLPALQFNMVGYPEILDQAEAYAARWLPYAETVAVSRFRPVGSRALWEGDPPFPFRPCPLLYRQMVIGWDGHVGLCCEDIHLTVDLGDVLESSLQHLFNKSSLLMAYRSSHERGRTQGLLLCQDCHVWGGNRVLSKKEHMIAGYRAEEIVTPAGRSFHKLEGHPHVSSKAQEGLQLQREGIDRVPRG